MPNKCQRCPLFTSNTHIQTCYPQTLPPMGRSQFLSRTVLAVLGHGYTVLL